MKGAFASKVGGKHLVRTYTAVAAAASVPSSLTSIKA